MLPEVFILPTSACNNRISACKMKHTNSGNNGKTAVGDVGRCIAQLQGKLHYEITGMQAVRDGRGMICTLWEGPSPPHSSLLY